MKSDTLTNNDFIPMDKFGLKWRFTEKKYNVLPKEVLGKIAPLSKTKACDLYKMASQLLSNACLIRSRFDHIDAFEISNNYEATVNWLNGRPIDPVTKIFVCWDEEDCVLTDYGIFSKYWDDFCYPSSDDILIWDSLDKWVLYYCHHEIFEYGTAKS